jgi:hypothetical protein
MNNEIYNRKTLTDYLLGKLSEADADTYDELSITDDNFADALKSVEDELIDSYLRGELIDADVRRFEASYLASPLLRKKVEFARTLKTVAEKNLVKPTEDKNESWAGIFAFWKLNSALRYGFAALFLTLTGIFGWFLLSKNKPDEMVKVQPTPTQQPSQQPTQQPTISPTQTPVESTPSPTASPKKTEVDKTPEPKLSPTLTPTPKPTIEPTKPPTPNVPTLATFVLLPATRSAGNLQTISIPEKTNAVAFKLPLESDDFKSYRVYLKNEAGKILWQSGKLASKKSALNVQFPSKILQTNIYSFGVVGIDEENEPQNIGNYSFKTVIK